MILYLFSMLIMGIASPHGWVTKVLQMLHRPTARSGPCTAGWPGFWCGALVEVRTIWVIELSPDRKYKEVNIVK